MLVSLAACSRKTAQAPPVDGGFEVAPSNSTKPTRILVTEDEPGVRVLRFAWNGARQSVVRMGAPLELQLPYLQASALVLALVPAPRRILIVGLGGGSMAMFLRTLYPEAEIDGIEIDPRVIRVAIDHLGFRPDAKLRAIADDGRAFTEKSAGGYDLIFLDAYGGDDVPRHLLAVAFMRTVRQKLAPGGYAVANVWKASHNPLFEDTVTTYRAAFGALCVLDVPGEVNTVVLGRSDGTAPLPSRSELKARATELQRAKGIPFDLAPYAAAECLEVPKGTVLVDP